MAIRAVSLFKIGHVSWHASEGEGARGIDRSIEKKGSKLMGWREGEKEKMEEEVKKAQEGSAS